MSKILFVVHRYVPYDGGSEYYVRDMAEECKRRLHDVTVLAHQNKGDQNGIKVTNDYNVLMDKWDLIIVHGADVVSQNIVHINAFSIKSPVVYMIIKPSESPEALNGMKHHRFISYSTSMDVEHLRANRFLYKGRRIRHGIVPEQTIGQPNIYDQPTYVSAGGFYPHKGMITLAEAFENSNIKGQLHLYGYIDGPMPKQTDKVKVFLGQSKYNVMCAIAGAEGYIMNSYEEGFGLVLLEAMMNKTPWYARNIAGAADMKKYGHVYENEQQLIELLSKPLDTKTEDAYNYVMANHTIHDTVNDIEDILMEIL